MTATAAEIRTLLARAYVADPLLTWVFQDDEDRLEATAAWLGVSVERHLEVGEVEHVREDGELAAVALWRRPGTVLAGPPGQLPTAGGLLQAIVGADRAADIAAGFAAAPRLPDDVPAAYLHFLAVAPDAQGRGLGGRLLDRVVARTRADGVLLRLDTTNPANLPFYRAHGLVVRAEERLGPTGPRIWRLETDVAR
ncbi:GNAT family N-acetyltransferase [Modestobacter sp. SSW1-42]|uniref:GNAT family N-acetyltransferase n=1 Tax=Modestobacter sp. SSW1-42 TaxID=596372 RepID=UPI003986EB5D